MPIIIIETEISAPKNIVFDLARSIDLHKISTVKTNEEAIAGVTSGLINLGESVTWRAKHIGLIQNLTTKITEFMYPEYFVDEMTKGIFKSFKHEHVFKEQRGKTLMIDRFEYESPFGFLGKIADLIFLEKYMTKFLTERNEIIKEFAETEKWKQVLLP